MNGKVLLRFLKIEMVVQWNEKGTCWRNFSTRYICRLISITSSSTSHWYLIKSLTKTATIKLTIIWNLTNFYHRPDSPQHKQNETWHLVKENNIKVATQVAEQLKTLNWVEIWPSTQSPQKKNGKGDPKLRKIRYQNQILWSCPFLCNFFNLFQIFCTWM